MLTGENPKNTVKDGSSLARASFRLSAQNKTQALAELALIRDGVMAERGSLRGPIAYCYEVRRGIEACLRAGCTTKEVEAALAQKSNLQPMKHKTNRHHIIPSSLENGEHGFENLKSEANIKNIRQKLHETLHAMFSNNPPHAQFQKLLNINWTVINPEVREELLKLLARKDFYKERFLKKRNF